MKKNFTITLFLLLFISTAFNNKVISQENRNADSGIKAPFSAGRPSIYSSDWESVSEWIYHKDDNLLSIHFSRNTPELSSSVLRNGVVVVFVRNLWAGVPAFEELG